MLIILCISTRWSASAEPTGYSNPRQSFVPKAGSVLRPRHYARDSASQSHFIATLDDFRMTPRFFFCIPICRRCVSKKSDVFSVFEQKNTSEIQTNSVFHKFEIIMTLSGCMFCHSFVRKICLLLTVGHPPLYSPRWPRSKLVPPLHVQIDSMPHRHLAPRFFLEELAAARSLGGSRYWFSHSFIGFLFRSIFFFVTGLSPSVQPFVFMHFGCFIFQYFCLLSVWFLRFLARGGPAVGHIGAVRRAAADLRRASAKGWRRCHLEPIFVPLLSHQKYQRNVGIMGVAVRPQPSRRLARESPTCRNPRI